MATTVPMLAPDGTSGDIPAAQVQAALAKGFKQAVEMTSPDGKDGYIPQDQAPNALKAGFKPKAGPAPTSGTQPGFWENLGHTFGIGSEEDAARLQQYQQHPVATTAENLMGPAYQAAEGLVGGFMRETGEAGQAVDALRQGNPAQAATHGIAALPFVGPALTKMAAEAPASTPGQSYLRQVAADATPGNVGTALGTAAQVAPMVLGAADQAAPGRPMIQTPLAAKAKAAFNSARSAISGGPEVEGQNFTPAQYRAHAAVIANGSPAGDVNYIPQDIAIKTGSLLRDVAGQSPDAEAAIQHGTPMQSIEGHQAILDRAKAKIDQAHEAVLQPFENTPVNTSAIQAALNPDRFKLQGMDPSDLRTINQYQQRVANITNLRGLNEFRMQMNDEDTTLGKNPTAAMSPGAPGIVHDLANDVRNAYYDNLQRVTGANMRPLKQMEGGVIQQIRGMAATQPRLAIAEAKAQAPLLRNTVGDIVEGSTRSGQVGIPVVGGAAAKLGEAIRGTPAAQLQAQLQKFYSNLSSTPTVQFPTARAIPRRLGAGAINIGAPDSSGAVPFTPPPFNYTTTAQRLGRMLPSPPIELPGAVQQAVPAYSPDTAAARLGRLLPAQSGAPTILPNEGYSPAMSQGERIAALMQMLRQRQQQALPSQASPIQLPPQF